MILLNSVIHIFAVADDDFRIFAWYFLAQTLLDVAFADGDVIGLASINSDLRRPSVTGKGLANKAFCSTKVTGLTKVKFYRCLHMKPSSF